MFDHKVMEQAIKIHGCNCDGCCVNTPRFQWLLKLRAAQLRIQRTKRPALVCAECGAETKMNHKRSCSKLRR
jgi:hypothetical protein